MVAGAVTEGRGPAFWVLRCHFLVRQVEQALVTVVTDLVLHLPLCVPTV